jgi:hypothetical protein
MGHLRLRSNFETNQVVDLERQDVAPTTRLNPRKDGRIHAVQVAGSMPSRRPTVSMKGRGGTRWSVCRHRVQRLESPALVSDATRARVEKAIAQARLGPQ